MMINILIISPIIETPAKTPEAMETIPVKIATVGRTVPSFLFKTAIPTVSSILVWAMTETKKVSPKINSIVSA